MNEAESDYLLSSISGMSGFKLVDSYEDADFIICNTCSVRKSAEERAEGFISQAKGMSKRNVRIILTGCMAFTSQDSLREKFPYIDYFVQNNDKDRILEILEKARKSEILSYDGSGSYVFRKNYHKSGDFFSYVPIQNGCNNFCSYCVVPYARGREVSRDFTEILDEMSYLDDCGVRVVTLLGQNVNSYKSGSRNFADLVDSISRMRFGNIKWIYFDSPHIKDFNTDLLDVLGSSDVFAKYFHVPVQSFSTSVLKSMNRKETQEDIYSFFEIARKKIPQAYFTTDVMVGFPTETQDDFRMTLDGVRNIGFVDAYMYYYNPRKGTAAYDKYADMDLGVKTSRLEELIELQGGISLEIRKAMLGGEFDLVARKPSRKQKGKMVCYSENNCAVLVDEDRLACGQSGRFVLKELKGRTFLA